MNRTRNSLLFVLLIALLYACQPKPLIGPEQTAGLEFPEAWYQQAKENGLSVYEVDDKQSEIVLIVRKEGRLARFGHDHVIRLKNLKGMIHYDPENPQTARADLLIPLYDLEVDPQDLREQFELDTEPSQKDIEGTRSNMHNKVLQTHRWPEVQISITPTEDFATTQQVNAEIHLHGTTVTYTVPINLEASDKGLQISGKLILNQSDFGIEPFSVLGGRLGIKDGVVSLFKIQITEYKDID